MTDNHPVQMHLRRSRGPLIFWKINVSGNAASLASQLIAEPRTKTAAAVRNDAPLLD